MAHGAARAPASVYTDVANGAGDDGDENADAGVRISVAAVDPVASQRASGAAAITSIPAPALPPFPSGPPPHRPGASAPLPPRPLREQPPPPPPPPSYPPPPRRMHSSPPPLSPGACDDRAYANGELSLVDAKDNDAPPPAARAQQPPRETGDDEAAAEHDVDAPMYAAADTPVLDATEARRLALLATNVREMRISVTEMSVLAFVNDTIARAARAGDFHCPYARGMQITDKVRAILYSRGHLPGLHPQTGEPILMW